jgi:hypothetical protein
MIFLAKSWCDEAAAALKELIDPDVLPILLAAINKGTATLWLITGDGWQSWMITRIESFASGVKELVIEVIAGKNSKAIFRRVAEVAKQNGIKSIRFETHHSEKTIARFVTDLNVKRVATVFRCEL